MINDLLKEECKIIIPSQEKDMFGKPMAPIEIKAKCRAKEKYKMVKNKSAESVVSEVEFWFSKDTDIKLDHMIVWNGIKYSIIAIQPKKDILGEIIYRVVFI